MNSMAKDLTTPAPSVVLDLLKQAAPEARVHEDRRFVDNGRVVVEA
jgi:hypothetical protein